MLDFHNRLLQGLLSLCAPTWRQCRSRHITLETLRFEWELLPESTDIRAGGDVETRPDAVRLNIVDQEDGMLAIRAPRRDGPYRMFVYAYDGNGNVATANFPFYVGQPIP